MRRVTVTDGCWEWQGARDRYGYGKIALTRSHPVGTHRVSYASFVGPIPAGLAVLHRCDNPPCVRPDHLYVGTAADNAADLARRGRSKQLRLSAANVLRIRELRDAGASINLSAVARELGVGAWIVSAVSRNKARRYAAAEVHPGVLHPSLETASAFDNAPHSSEIRGVTKHKRTGKWQAQLSRHNRLVYLGLYATREEAAHAVQIFINQEVHTV